MKPIAKGLLFAMCVLFALEGWAHRDLKLLAFGLVLVSA